MVPPQIIHFNRVFHYKPSILGYHYFWKHPIYIYIYIYIFFGGRPEFGVDSPILFQFSPGFSRWYEGNQAVAVSVMAMMAPGWVVVEDFLFVSTLFVCFVLFCCVVFVLVVSTLFIEQLSYLLFVFSKDSNTLITSNFELENNKYVIIFFRLCLNLFI